MHIEINHYPLNVLLGLYQDERHVGQDVLVSLDVEMADEGLSAVTDDIDLTVDYGDIFKVLEESVQGREFSLVEAVVLHLGKTLMERFPLIKRLKVSVEKTVIKTSLTKGAQVRLVKQFER